MGPKSKYVRRLLVYVLVLDAILIIYHLLPVFQWVESAHYSSMIYPAGFFEPWLWCTDILFSDFLSWSNVAVVFFAFVFGLNIVMILTEPRSHVQT